MGGGISCLRERQRMQAAVYIHDLACNSASKVRHQECGRIPHFVGGGVVPQWRRIGNFAIEIAKPCDASRKS